MKRAYRCSTWVSPARALHVYFLTRLPNFGPTTCPLILERLGQQRRRVGVQYLCECNQQDCSSCINLATGLRLGSSHSLISVLYLYPRLNVFNYVFQVAYTPFFSSTAGSVSSSRFLEVTDLSSSSTFIIGSAITCEFNVFRVASYAVNAIKSLVQTFRMGHENQRPFFL